MPMFRFWNQFGKLCVALILALPVPAAAASFTEAECKLVAEVVAATVRTVGADTLSVGFRRSMGAFLSPDGRTLTCAGSTRIVADTIDDAAAFDTMRTILLQGNAPISLQRRGLELVRSR